jgi:hypothetical protein
MYTLLLVVSVTVIVVSIVFRAAPLWKGRQFKRTRFPRPMAPSIAPQSPRPDVPEPSPAVAIDPMIQLVFPLQGLAHRRDLASALELRLRQLGGVARVYVSPATDLAYVEFQPVEIQEDQLVGVMEAEGFAVGEHGERFLWKRASQTDVPGRQAAA